MTASPLRRWQLCTVRSVSSQTRGSRFQGSFTPPSWRRNVRPSIELCRLALRAGIIPKCCCISVTKWNFRNDAALTVAAAFGINAREAGCGCRAKRAWLPLPV
jgi:hypothetical protein